MTEVTLRVYGPLNDFLPRDRRQTALARTIDGRPSVKDVIEGCGIPHPEIDLIVVNGTARPFDYLVQQVDRIAAYPRFATLDVDADGRIRRPALDVPRFVADVHLG